MSDQNKGGRPKEIFQLHFNEDLRPQLQIMTIKQLIRLLLVILSLIPYESFSRRENETNSSSIFCFVGKVIRKVTQKEIVEEQLKYENIDNWMKAKKASAIHAFETSHPITKSFFLD